ncbi:MAG TPA: NAD(P)-binding domain-containing protein, partial [Chitinophagaceae bacterium]|nr:NAD(P)-binding domain-containing protein [Chitinophagaceae bacterium]
DYYTFFEEYVAKYDLPVKENSKVLSIEKPADIFDVTISSPEGISHYSSRNVIIASGYASETRIPPFADKIDLSVKQLHASQYRNAGQLPAGAVLVVGSAQSGCQIAEDLADAGRKVFLSTSMVARVPRRYRGRDIMEWLIDMKFFDMRAEDIPDPAMRNMKPPQITGTGGGRHTISLQSFAKKGVTILGKTENAEGKSITLQPNAAMHVKFADGFSKKVKEMIDEFILKAGTRAEPPEADENDMPDENAACASPLTSLDLEENNIRSIIWSTGFSGDFSYLKLPVFDEEGNLKHKDGLPAVPGLYFLGYPWLRGRKSLLIFGIKGDAEFVADRINSTAASQSKTAKMEA